MTGVLVMQPATVLQVTKPFHGDGVQRLRGEVVDASAWRTAQALVDMRFLIAVSSDAVILDCPCGRRWSGAIAEHPCQPRRRGPAPTKE